MKQKTMNLDADESMFFERELEHIKSKAYEKKYPKLKALMVFPVSREASPGAESITYRFFDKRGVARIIANYADDIPTSEVTGKEFTSSIRGIASGYTYNLMEIREAAMANKPLKQKKADAARYNNDVKVDKIAWYGDDNYGLVGLFNNPNITAGSVRAGATTGNFKFEEKNPDEILSDLNYGPIDIRDLTNGEEDPDTLLLPVKQHGIVTSTYRSDGSDLTILDAFLKANPGITRVEWVPDLKDVNPLPSGDTGPKDVMVFFERDIDKISLEIPQAWEQLEPQPQNYSYKVPCHSRCGGLIIYYPLSVNVVEGI